MAPKIGGWVKVLDQRSNDGVKVGGDYQERQVGNSGDPFRAQRGQEHRQERRRRVPNARSSTFVSIATMNSPAHEAAKSCGMVGSRGFDRLLGLLLTWLLLFGCPVMAAAAEPHEPGARRWSVVLSGGPTLFYPHLLLGSSDLSLRRVLSAGLELEAGMALSLSASFNEISPHLGVIYRWRRGPWHVVPRARLGWSFFHVKSIYPRYSDFFWTHAFMINLALDLQWWPWPRLGLGVALLSGTGWYNDLWLGSWDPQVMVEVRW